MKKLFKKLCINSVILRCRRHFSIRCWYNFKASLRGTKNLSKTHPSLTKVGDRNAAFTLAEVLITLGIIGVVAAIVLPNLIQKYQEHVTITKLKKVYQLITEAEQRSSIENGEPITWTEIETDTGQIFEYFSKYYLPYIKAPYKVYKPKEKDSRRVVQVYTLTNAKMANSVSRTEEVRFADNSCFYFGANGQFVMLIYDTNCEKKPNVYGKDVWNMFEFRWFNRVERTYQNCRHGCHRAQVPFITSSTVKDSEFEPYCRTSTAAISGAPNECFGFLFYDGFQFDHKKRNWK